MLLSPLVVLLGHLYLLLHRRCCYCTVPPPLNSPQVATLATFVLLLILPVPPVVSNAAAAALFHAALRSMLTPQGNTTTLDFRGTFLAASLRPKIQTWEYKLDWGTPKPGVYVPESPTGLSTECPLGTAFGVRDTLLSGLLKEPQMDPLNQ